MGETRNLENEEAIRKIRSLAEDIRIAMVCTRSSRHLVETRPMATQAVEDDGTVWFLCRNHSDLTQELELDAEIQLIYAQPGETKFLTISGKGVVSQDRALIRKYWTPIAKTWFPAGPDDPALGLLSVKISDAYYWDTKHGKMVSLLKIAVGAVTGKTMDDGIEGHLQP